MASHVLCDFQLAPVLEVGGDSRRPKAVSADLGPEARRFRPPLNHQVHIGLGQGDAASQPSIAQGREEWGVGFAGEP